MLSRAGMCGTGGAAVPLQRCCSIARRLPCRHQSCSTATWRRQHSCQLCLCTPQSRRSPLRQTLTASSKSDTHEQRQGSGNLQYNWTGQEGAPCRRASVEPTSYEACRGEADSRKESTRHACLRASHTPRASSALPFSGLPAARSDPLWDVSRRRTPHMACSVEPVLRDASCAAAACSSRNASTCCQG